jgi:hypothetical protein
MKALVQHAAALLLLAPGVCLRSRLTASPNSMVYFVNAIRGTITISGDDTPFMVGADATILIDGRPAALRDVQKGMEVISRTAHGFSAPVINLKRVKS